MRISFDLDGVITSSSKWFFRLLDMIREVNPQSPNLQRTEIDYYDSLELRLNPNLFLANEDEGFIITCRKPYSKQVTLDWLAKYGIRLPVFFVDEKDEIDWMNYREGSLRAAKIKARKIESLGVGIHFDNNPYLIEILRQELPDIKIIAIGAEDDYEKR